MVGDRFIWCCTCNEVHHVTPFDEAPRYQWDHGEQIELPMDDRRAFMRRHSGHRLEGLRSVGERYFPSGSLWDPMKVGYLEVTNGTESFVLRSVRHEIEEPLHFELIRGRLRPAEMTVSIRENELRKEMRHHFPWRLSEKLDNEQIELFIAFFEEVVRELDPRYLELRGFDGDGSALCGVLSAASVERLMQSCRTRFDPATVSGLRRFVDTHRDGVMTLRIVKRYEIEPSTGS
jgi:hypothetical protein